MTRHAISFAAAALAVAAAAAIPNTANPAADRHAGVWQFAPLPEGWCAGHTPDAWRQQAPARLTPLGALPPAYVIRLTAPAAAPPSDSPFVGGPGPTPKGPYDPCARVAPALVRVR